MLQQSYSVTATHNDKKGSHSIKKKNFWNISINLSPVYTVEIPYLSFCVFVKQNSILTGTIILNSSNAADCCVTRVNYRRWRYHVNASLSDTGGRITLFLYTTSLYYFCAVSLFACMYHGIAEILC